jgi:hypothetical protein
MKTNCLLHAAAAQSPITFGKNAELTSELVWALWKRQKSPPKIEPLFSGWAARSLVTILTALSQLLASSLLGPNILKAENLVYVDGGDSCKVTNTRIVNL